MPDGRGLYSDVDYISSDNTHLTQAGYAYYKEYTNNLIASGHCHFVFRKTPKLTITCGTEEADCYLEIELTEKSVNMNVIPPTGTTIAIDNPTIPSSGYFKFATYTAPFKNMPYLPQNYLINGLNLLLGSAQNYAVYGSLTLLVVPQANDGPKITGFVNSSGLHSNGLVRGGCTAVTSFY